MRKINVVISWVLLVLAILALLNFLVKDDGEMGSSTALIVYLFIIVYAGGFVRLFRKTKSLNKWLEVCLTVGMLLPMILLTILIIWLI